MLTSCITWGPCLPNLRSHFGTLLLAIAGTFSSAQAPIATRLLLPTAIAYDATGNLYIADTNRNQVLEATLGGTLRVIAGTGTQGFSGDTGPATAAQLNAPQGLAIAPDGTLYLADTGNHRLRAIDAAGIITTLAGTGRAAFAGDGATATLAALNHPTALTVSATTLYIADTDNHRIRAITNGLITTIAGTGLQGFAGDDGPATAAQLDSPQGLAIASDGTLILADTRNQRLRRIDATGTITTIASHLASPHGLTVTPSGTLLIADTNNHRLASLSSSSLSAPAGSGTQGSSPESTAAASAELDLPRATAVDAFGSPVIADTGNARILLLWSDGLLHPPAAFAPARTTLLNATAPSTAVYGAAAAGALILGLGKPQGSVQLLEAQHVLAQSPLSTDGHATLALTALSAGTHTLQLSYSGDGVNPSATQPLALTVTPASATATPAALSLAFGQPQPPLTGTLAGILPQDATAVSATFATSTTTLAPPGTYPITATLTGPAAANYALTIQPASLTITRAGTTTTLATPQTLYAGIPTSLSASVAPAFRGTATGSVTFSDNATPIASASLIAGAAAASWTPTTSGPHNLTVQYTGDANFLAGTSLPTAAAVAALPDFALTATTTSQQVQSGSSATFPLTLAPSPAPFTGAVTFKVTGLPSGATATFSPAQIVPATTTTSVTLTISTPARAVDDHQPRWTWLAAFLIVPLLARRRLRLFSLTLLTLSLTACGDRVFPNTATASPSTYTLQATGTATNLAGAVVTHTVALSLTVQ